MTFYLKACLLMLKIPLHGPLIVFSKPFSKLIKRRFQRDALKFGYKMESQKTLWAAWVLKYIILVANIQRSKQEVVHVVGGATVMLWIKQDSKYNSWMTTSVFGRIGGSACFTLPKKFWEACGRKNQSESFFFFLCVCCEIAVILH